MDESWLLLLVAAANCCCWLLLLVPAADCCCWLLLLVAAIGCCCWLLLLIAGCGWDTACWRKSVWIFPAYWWFAAKKILQPKKSLNISRILIICGSDNSAGNEIFETFRDFDDLRLRQFCRRKSLWNFPGYWWFAAKTILQATKSLNISGILMICG